MKKFLSLIVFIFTISSVTVFALSTDIEYANKLASKGIINNHIDNPSEYNLWDNVLRQEIAAVARWVYESRLWKDIWSEKKSTCDNIFWDVNLDIPNNWACYSIESLVDNDLIAANDTFRPEDNITKAESLGMLIKAIGFDYSYNPNINKTWQEQIVDFSVENWVVENFDDYNSDATRWWIFNVANHVIQVHETRKSNEKKQERISWEVL